jgi:type II secretory pathway component GspD/PulD (secretin)
MNRTQLIRSALAFALAVLAFPAGAQNTLDIIPLRHRTAQQVLPVLQPLLEPGGALSGHGNQLIVRASPANLAELRRALEAIDRPQRRLQISVRFDDTLESQQQGAWASARIGERGARVDVRARDDRAAASERIDQRIQVLEGGRAFIMAGQSVPLPLSGDATQIRELATGFEAVPRLAGNTVLLDIAPRRETTDRQQHLTTTVSARLGEWFEVGGAATSDNRNHRGIASASRSNMAESRRVWLKVEEIRQ